MGKWRREELIDNIMPVSKSYLKAVDKEIGLLVTFADSKVDVKKVEKER